MEEVVYARYLNPGLNIALKDWREVYLLSSAPQRLLPEVHRGKLVYRARVPVSGSATSGSKKDW